MKHLTSRNFWLNQMKKLIFLDNHSLQKFHCSGIISVDYSYFSEPVEKDLIDSLFQCLTKSVPQGKLVHRED